MPAASPNSTAPRPAAPAPPQAAATRARPVPATRLLVWTACCAVPALTLAGFAPDLAPAGLLLFVLLVLVAAADAVAGCGRLDGFAVEIPAVVRLTRKRAGEIALRLLRREPGGPERLRFALPLPPGFTPAQEELALELAPAAGAFPVAWACTPLHRGRYHLDGGVLECASPLGFWQMRRPLPFTAEVRVHPDLAASRRDLAGLFLHRGLTGVHPQRQLGHGREFEKLRDYLPGDSFEDIHWKATAKRRSPVTKEFQIEHTQEVYVVIDASRLSARPSDLPGDTLLDRFVTASLVLGLAAEKQGDLFGLVTATDQVRGFIRAKSGREHFQACRDLLFPLQPQPVNPDFDNLCAFLRTRLRRRALLVFLTSLDDPLLAETFARNAERLARQHVVLVGMPRPAGVRPLFSPASADAGNAATDADLPAELAGHLQWRRLRELEKELQRHGVRFSLLEQDRLVLQLVAQYLAIKQRQLL